MAILARPLKSEMKRHLPLNIVAREAYEQERLLKEIDDASDFEPDSLPGSNRVHLLLGNVTVELWAIRRCLDDYVDDQNDRMIGKL